MHFGVFVEQCKCHTVSAYNSKKCNLFIYISLTLRNKKNGKSGKQNNRYVYEFRSQKSYNMRKNSIPFFELLKLFTLW